MIQLAGLPPIPKPFVNMRASFATELVQTYPGHVAAAWLGNTEATAYRHYRMVLDEHFERAAGGTKSGTESGTPAAQKAAQQAAARVGKVGKVVPEPIDDYRSMPTLARRKSLLHKDLLGDNRLERLTFSV